MPYRYVTHPNGFTERVGNPTPEEEREFFKKITGVKSVPPCLLYTSPSPRDPH